MCKAGILSDSMCGELNEILEKMIYSQNNGEIKENRRCDVEFEIDIRNILE